MNAANTELVIRAQTKPVTVERRVGGRDFIPDALGVLAKLVGTSVSALGDANDQWVEVARYAPSGKRMAEEHAKWLNDRHPSEEYRAREMELKTAGGDSR